MIIETSVHATAAAWMVARRDTGADDDLTVVWSTTPMSCPRCASDDPRRLVLHYTADDPPLLDDRTGRGDWWVLSTQQCRCGDLVTVPSVVCDGHLSGAALAEIAQQIAEEADQERATQIAEIRRRLLRDLRAARAEDRSRMRDWADSCGPEVCIKDGRLMAWDYAPGSDEISDAVTVFEAT